MDRWDISALLEVSFLSSTTMWTRAMFTARLQAVRVEDGWRTKPDNWKDSPQSPELVGTCKCEGVVEFATSGT